MGTAGEVEGRGFGIGVATSSQRHIDAQNTNKNRAKKGKENQWVEAPPHPFCMSTNPSELNW